MTAIKDIEFYVNDEYFDVTFYGYLICTISDYYEVEDIYWNRKHYSPHENEMIDKYVNENEYNICDQLIKSHLVLNG